MLTNILIVTADDSFIILADMTTIKYKTLHQFTKDDDDDDTYVLYEGDKYFSSYSALAYDDVMQTVYFSDVNR